MKRMLVGAFALVVIATPIAVAHAQGGRDPAAAQALFDKGVELQKAGDWTGACAKFDASMKLDPSVGTQINLARCADHDGLIARAWAEFKRAKVLNQETAGAQRKKEIDAYLDQEIAKLETRLPHVTVKLSPQPEGARVERDGALIPVSGLGQTVPIDPGSHTFSASATGYKTATKTVEIAEGATLEVVLELVADPTAPPTPDAPPSTPKKPANPPVASGPDWMIVAGGVLSGVGALTLAASAVTGGIAYSDRGTIDELLDEGVCTSAGETITCQSSAARDQTQEAADRGEPLALASTITLFTGAAIAATGLTLVIVGSTRGSSSEPKVDARVLPLWVPGGGGVGIGGAF
ncbi:MAG: PEGA domain-containing protein [Polyangiaceae bacterium]|nr:PEGA domain-containing protein [Polyangiaceae bacterium]